MSDDEAFGGFGGDGGGGDDFGFGDDFGEALQEAQDEFNDDDKQHISESFQNLPESDNVEHSPEPEEEEEYEAEAEEDGTSHVNKEAKITGQKSGWMKMLAAKAKFTVGKKAWREKWFVLKGGKFSIANGPADTTKMQTIDLTHALAFEKDPGDDADTFTLVTKSKTFFFKTRSGKDCISWVNNLQKAKANYLGSFSSSTKETNSSLLF